MERGDGDGGRRRLRIGGQQVVGARSRNDTKIPNLFPVGDDGGGRTDGRTAAQFIHPPPPLAATATRTRAWPAPACLGGAQKPRDNGDDLALESREKGDKVKPIQRHFTPPCEILTQNEARHGRQLSPVQINLSLSGL